MLDDGTHGALSAEGRDGRLSPPPDIGTTDDDATERQLELDGAEIVLSAMPMARAGGWGVLVAAWQAGATLVFAGPWLDGGSLRALAESEGATVVAAPPRLWRGLRARIERDGAVLPRLRRAILGTAEIIAIHPERDPRAA